MRNILLSKSTSKDIDVRVGKILKGLGNPSPPLQLEDVRELLRLDMGYYSTSDDSFLREMISKLTVAGAQVLQRPSLILDAVKKFDLRALYLPDRKRILLDSAQPTAKQRWNEAHEIGHSILPWHADLMLGDNQQTLAPSCHAIIEAEANYAAGQLLFLQNAFLVAANDSAPSIEAIKALKGEFGNTLTTTMWRYVEDCQPGVPMIGMIGPHPNKLPEDFDDSQPFKYIIESPAFRSTFLSPTAPQLHQAISVYCGHQRAGPLGSDEIVLTDNNGSRHVFYFESFYNYYDCLTLAVYSRPYLNVVGF